MAKHVIGLEWRSSIIKVVQGTVSRSAAEGLSVIGLIERSGMNPDALADTLRTCVKEYVEKNTSVYVLLPRTGVIVKNIELPSSDPHEIARMLHLQLERYVPFDADDVVADFLMTPSAKQGYAQVVLAALAKKELIQITDILTKSGIPIDCLSLTACGSAAYCCQQHAHLMQHGAMSLIVDADTHDAEFILVKDTDIVFTRSSMCRPVNKRGQVLTTAVIDHMLAELKRTFDMARQQGVLLDIAHVFLGDGLADYVERFKEAVGGAVSVHMLTSALSVSSKKQLHEFERQVSFLSLAGIGAIESFPFINLLSTAHKEKSLHRRQQADKILAMILSAVLAIVIIGFLGFFFVGQYRTLHMIEEKLRAVAPEAEKMDTMVQTIRVINEVRRAKEAPVKMLAELYRLIPGDIYLTYMIYSEGQGIELKGIASEISEVSDLLLLLQQSLHFASAEIRYAKQKRVGSKEVTDFEIICSL